MIVFVLGVQPQKKYVVSIFFNITQLLRFFDMVYTSILVLLVLPLVFPILQLIAWRHDLADDLG